MQDPALTKELTRLAEVVVRLNKASDSLNAIISELEGYLLELSPGLTVWCKEPLRVINTYGSQVGFAKVKDEWALWIRRGFFGKTNNGWAPRSNNDWTYVRLVNAHREERVAAIKEFPELIEAMRLVAEQQLAALERATKLAR